MRGRLDAAIEAHSGAAFAFLEALVRAPSVLGHEQAAMELFAGEAAAAGLAVERLPFAAGPVDDPLAGIAPPADAVSAGRFQVLAATPGDGAMPVLLNGHMDVVPATTPELWTSPPFRPERRGGRLYGRGAADMKCGFAVGLLALQALRDAVPDLFARRRLGFLAVLEEECTGNGTLDTIRRHRILGEEVVVLESTGLGLMTGGIGILWLDIAVIAAAGHAHEAEAGANAVELGMRLVRGLRDWAAELDAEHPGGPAHAVNLGRIAAGDWVSSAPAVARLGVRVGFPRGWTAAEAERRLRERIAALAAGDPGFAAPPEVTLTGFRAEGYDLAAPSPLTEALAAAHAEAHGAPPATFALGSTTDARLYLAAGVPAVCYGATGGRLHGIDEYVELASIPAAARTLARFLLTRYGGAAA